MTQVNVRKATADHDTAEFVVICCSMSVVSVQPFL